MGSISAVDLELWPSGLARLADGILEVTTGEPIRVPVSDIIEIGWKPPRAGRLSLTLRYRAGLDTVSGSWWVESRNEAALHALIEAVEASRA
jgi:hypothetical protein